MDLLSEYGSSSEEEESIQSTHHPPPPTNTFNSRRHVRVVAAPPITTTTDRRVVTATTAVTNVEDDGGNNSRLLLHSSSSTTPRLNSLSTHQEGRQRQQQQQPSSRTNNVDDGPGGSSNNNSSGGTNNVGRGGSTTTTSSNNNNNSATSSTTNNQRPIGGGLILSSSSRDASGSISSSDDIRGILNPGDESTCELDQSISFLNGSIHSNRPDQSFLLSPIAKDPNSSSSSSISSSSNRRNLVLPPTGRRADDENNTTLSSATSNKNNNKMPFDDRSNKANKYVIVSAPTTSVTGSMKKLPPPRAVRILPGQPPLDRSDSDEENSRNKDGDNNNNTTSSNNSRKRAPDKELAGIGKTKTTTTTTTTTTATATTTTTAAPAVPTEHQPPETMMVESVAKTKKAPPPRTYNTMTTSTKQQTGALVATTPSSVGVPSGSNGGNSESSSSTKKKRAVPRKNDDGTDGDKSRKVSRSSSSSSSPSATADSSGGSNPGAIDSQRSSIGKSDNSLLVTATADLPKYNGTTSTTGKKKDPSQKSSTNVVASSSSGSSSKLNGATKNNGKVGASDPSPVRPAASSSSKEHDRKRTTIDALPSPTTRKRSKGARGNDPDELAGSTPPKDSTKDPNPTPTDSDRTNVIVSGSTTTGIMAHGEVNVSESSGASDSTSNNSQGVAVAKPTQNSSGIDAKSTGESASTNIVELGQAKGSGAAGFIASEGKPTAFCSGTETSVAKPPTSSAAKISTTDDDDMMAPPDDDDTSEEEDGNISEDGKTINDNATVTKKPPPAVGRAKAAASENATTTKKQPPPPPPPPSPPVPPKSNNRLATTEQQEPTASTSLEEEDDDEEEEGPPKVAPKSRSIVTWERTNKLHCSFGDCRKREEADFSKNMWKRFQNGDASVVCKEHQGPAQKQKEARDKDLAQKHKGSNQDPSNCLSTLALPRDEAKAKASWANHKRFHGEEARLEKMGEEPNSPLHPNDVEKLIALKNMYGKELDKMAKAEKSELKGTVLRYYEAHPNAFIPGSIRSISKNFVPDTTKLHHQHPFTIVYYANINQDGSFQITPVDIPKSVFNFLWTKVGVAMIRKCINKGYAKEGKVYPEIGFSSIFVRTQTYYAGKPTPEGNQLLQTPVVGSRAQVWVDVGPIRKFFAAVKDSDVSQQYPDEMEATMLKWHREQTANTLGIRGGCPPPQQSNDEATTAGNSNEEKYDYFLDNDGNRVELEQTEQEAEDDERSEKEKEDNELFEKGNDEKGGGKYNCYAETTCAVLKLTGWFKNEMVTVTTRNGKTKEINKVDLLKKELSALNFEGMKDKQIGHEQRMKVQSLGRIQTKMYKKEYKKSFELFSGCTDKPVIVEMNAVQCVHYVAFYKGMLIDGSLSHALKITRNNLEQILGGVYSIKGQPFVICLQK